MLIPQYQVLVLKLSPIYTVSLNTVFSIPQNQCYPGTPCTMFTYLINDCTKNNTWFFYIFSSQLHELGCLLYSSYLPLGIPQGTRTRGPRLLNYHTRSPRVPDNFSLPPLRKKAEKYPCVEYCPC